MANVIDSLVVTLGLDSKGFAEGVKGSTDQLAGFTRKLAGTFLAVKGIGDLVSYFKDLSAELAEVGFQSRNLGVAGKELKKLGEVSELFGGQVGDAAASVQGLQSDIFALRFNGTMSQSLQMLQRFGVAYLDAAGHARKFEDVAKDAAAAIDKQARIAGLDKGERYQLALSFGFQGGIASAVAQGGAGLKKALERSQVDQQALTEKTIDGQVQLSRDLTSQHEALAAVNSTLLAKMTPAIEQLNKWMADLIKNTVPLLIKAIDALIDFFKNPPPWLAFIESALKGLTDVLGPTGTLLSALGAVTLAMVNLPLAIITGLGVFIGTLLDKIAPKLFGGIAEFLVDKFGPQYDPNAPPAAGSTVPGTAKGVIVRPGFAAPPTPTAPRAGSAAQQSAAIGGRGGTGTQVHIDNMTINTQATDAHAMATDVNSALERKIAVGQSDAGQQ